MIEEKKHAKFGASSSDRWLNCPGSTALIEIAPPAKSSKYADEGTTAHSILEQAILCYQTKGGRPHLLFNDLTKKHGKEMVNHVRTAYDRIIDAYLNSAVGSILLSETKVELPVSYEGQFGTVDAAIVEEFGVLTVIDYKHGAGIPVSPVENPQLIYYALGLSAQYFHNFDFINLVVIQPRACDDPKDAVKSWKMSIDDLMMWKDKFEAAITANLKKDAPLNPGEKWCRFCPASVICPAISTKAIEEAQGDFSPSGTLALPSPKQIENLPRVLNLLPFIELWVKQVREHAFDVFDKGGKIEGWKLVEKRSTRKWVNVEKTSQEALLKYGDKAFSQPELLSPAQFEKVVKDVAFVKERVSSVSSGLTLVSDQDKRAGTSSIEADFTEV